MREMCKKNLSVTYQVKHKQSQDKRTKATPEPTGRTSPVQTTHVSECVGFNVPLDT